MTPAVAEALHLASNGVPVFPCWPDGYGSRPDGRPYYKSPRIAGWQLYASADQSVVQQWWQQWPDSLVAVPTGQRSGLYVLDLDVKPEQGVDGRVAVQPLQPPVTRVNHTLTGGMHLLYRLPETGTARTDAGMLGAGIDRRGDGGYVVWWPAHGGAVTSGPVAPCPQWMVGEAGRDGVPSDTLPPMGLTDADIHDLLRRIRADDMSGRSEWLRVGMALHHEYGGSEAGLLMWNAYSMLWPNYTGRQALEREWGTFGRTGRLQVTLRSYVPTGWRSVPPDVAFAGGVILPAIATGLPFAVPNLPQAVRDARDGTATTRPLTEAGNAMRMHDRYSQVLRYVTETEGWLYWHDGQWLSDPKGAAVCHLAARLAEDVYAEGATNVTESMTYVKWARKCGELRVARATVALLALYPDMRLSASMLNTDIWLAGLNGARQVLDLRTGAVRAAVPGDYITKSLGVCNVGRPDGSSRWLSFVSEVFGGDMALVRWMQRWFGYCLTGSTREEILVFAYGMGRNGKGTMFDTVARVLGEYSATVDKKTFQESAAGGGAASPDLFKLQGARFILSSETTDATVDESQIKTMTGGDQITARGLYKDPVTFYPQFKINILGNQKPVIRNMDHGIWSRIRLVPFLRIFTEPDKTLKDRFRDEAEHILAWMLEGCLAWQQDGLGDVPAAVSEATGEYKKEMDTLGIWIAERCVERSDVSAMSAILYSSYRDWAEKNGYKAPLTAQSFSRRLIDRGVRKIHTMHGSMWKSISVRT